VVSVVRVWSLISNSALQNLADVANKDFMTGEKLGEKLLDVPIGPLYR
jgi:hypothetical protein